MDKLAEIAADAERAARLTEAGPELRDDDKIRDPGYWARRAVDTTFFDMQRAVDRFASSMQPGRALSFEQEFRLFMVRRQLHEIAEKGVTKYATRPVDEVWPINLKAAE